MRHHTGIMTHGTALNSRRHWWGEVDNMLVELHLSETNGPCLARTWTTRLTDGDANIMLFPHPRKKHEYCDLLKVIYRTPRLTNGDANIMLFPHPCKRHDYCKNEAYFQKC